MTSEPVVFDSNIYLYSFDSLSSKYNLAKNLVERAVSRKLEVLIAYQNLNETFAVMTRKDFTRDPFTTLEALRQLDRLRNSLGLITPTWETFDYHRHLLSEHHLTGQSVYDCFLAATMLSNGVRLLYTDNEKDFKKFKEIKVVNPFK